MRKEVKVEKLAKLPDQRTYIHLSNLRRWKLNKNNKTGYRGVFLTRAESKSKNLRYLVKLDHNGVYIQFRGHYQNKDHAAMRYNKEALKLKGEKALLNTISLNKI